jgi:hypothetical protein
LHFRRLGLIIIVVEVIERSWRSLLSLKIAVTPEDKERAMSSWAKRLENWFSAVAFAEAGEHKTALEMVGLAPIEAKQPVSILQTLNTTFAAAAFAEANCHDIAKEILDADAKQGSFSEVTGLKGIRIWYGHVPATQGSFFEAVGLKGVRLRFGTVSI